MHTPTGNNIRGFVYALVASLLWGILPIALKEIITVMDAYTIVWYRFTFAALVLFFVLKYRRELPVVASLDHKILLALFIASVGLCANYVLFSMSLNHLNAETTEAVIQLTTLFLLLGGILIFREPFLPLQRIGTLLIVIGLGGFFNDRFSELFVAELDIGFGVMLVIIAALTWVVYALLQKQLLRYCSSNQILLIVYIVCALLLIPLAVPAQVSSLSVSQFWLLVFCCLNTVVAYGCFGQALVHWHASKVSAVLALAPVFTILGIKMVVILNPTYRFTDNLNFLSIAAALVLVLGSVMVALVPVFSGVKWQRKLTG